MTTQKEFDEMPSDTKLYLRALYELSLEACGGNQELFNSLSEGEYPNIFEGDLEKRFLKLKSELIGGRKCN
jgi:hypothetical protein